MLNRFKSAMAEAIESFEGPKPGTSKSPVNTGQPKYPYSRPSFMKLSDVAVSISKDKKVRPILSASSSSPLPFNVGYAECVNAGKSEYNEDLAQIYHGILRSDLNHLEEGIIEYSYYGIFDGHAGYGAALDASKQLHHILHQKLVNSMDVIFSPLSAPPLPDRVDIQLLITGCLESAFVEMDAIIGETRKEFQNPGGCTAIVALFILGKLYVANAGDCRAAICDNGIYKQASNDFSPEFDKDRIYRKASENITLLGGDYNIRDYIETPNRDNLGRMVMYKEPYMKGWSFKTLSPSDLKTPLITGCGRRSRIMGTIGVARGFGDFDLTSIYHKVPIKPLLSCVPEVMVFTQEDLVTDYSVLVMASDGLWDAVDPTDVADMCCNISMRSLEDNNRYLTVAMNLVANARGKKDHTTNMWLLNNSNLASVDDITVFIIPFRPHAYMRWNIVLKLIPKPLEATVKLENEEVNDNAVETISDDDSDTTVVAPLSVEVCRLKNLLQTNRRFVDDEEALQRQDEPTTEAGVEDEEINRGIRENGAEDDEEAVPGPSQDSG